MKRPPLFIGFPVVAIVLSLVVFWSRPDSPASIPITTRSAQARQYFLKGRDLADRLRESEACEYFEKAVNQDPRFAYAYLYLSRLHSNAKTRLAFLARAEELAKSVSEGERLLIMGAVAYNNRQSEMERDLMTRLVESYPNDARAHNEFGNTLYWQKDWQAATERYLKALSIDPSFSQACNGLGYCYRFTGDVANAELYFERYIELLPDDPNPYDSYGDLLSEMNRHEEAISMYQKAVALRPDFANSYLGMSWNYCVLGRFSEAIDQLNTLLEASSDDRRRRRALLGMAAVHVEQGNLDQAASTLQLSCDIGRNSGDQPALYGDLRSLGLVLLEAGRPDDASRAFSASLQAVQDYPGAPKSELENAQLDHMRSMALVWLTRGDYTKASDFARSYLEITSAGPDLARVRQAHQTLGLVKLASGDIDRAIEELSQGDLEEAYTQYHLARAYEARGIFSRALQYYQAASVYDQFSPLTQAFVRKRAKDAAEALLLAQQTQNGTAATSALPSPIDRTP